MPFGDSENVRVGESVVALSRGLDSLSHVVGMVTKVLRERDNYNKKFISGLHIDAAFPRSSHLETHSNAASVVADKPGTLPFLGAPLIGATGHLMAVVGPEGWPAKRSQQDAGDVLSARVYADEIAYESKSDRGDISRLPFGWSDFTVKEAKQLGLPVTHGIVVEYVYPGEAAARAGLRAGSA